MQFRILYQEGRDMNIAAAINADDIAQAATLFQMQRPHSLLTKIEPWTPEMSPPFRFKIETTDGGVFWIEADSFADAAEQFRADHEGARIVAIVRC